MPYRLSYLCEFGSITDLKEALERCETISLSSNNILLTIANSYLVLGYAETSLELLSMLGEDKNYDNLRYNAIATIAMDSLGNYKESLNYYKKFNELLAERHYSLLEEKIQFSDEKHKIELQAQKDSYIKSKMIWTSVSICIILLFCVIVLVLISHNNKIKRNNAIQQATIIELENEKLRYEQEIILQEKNSLNLDNKKLTLEKESLLFEQKNKTIESEQLKHYITILEEEKSKLEQLLKDYTEYPEAVQGIIKERIEMLNILLAFQISSNDQYNNSYEHWVQNIISDSQKFMESNKLAFTASHPKFIKYLENHGLTSEEINYVCLYAIGLKGKEVGNYLKKRSHVNMSSAIRKKLGIDKHETNIGIYVRRLLKNL